MSDESLPEPKHENGELDPPTEINRNPLSKLREFEDHPAASKQRHIRGAWLAANLPSHCLKRGIGILRFGGQSNRHQHRQKLWRLLNKLVRRHHWAEASGVLCVLLQGTVADKSQSRNRAKYSAALEVLNNIKCETISSRRIQSVHELWMKKLGPLKKWSPKERFAVQLEFIIACIQHGNMEDAYQATLCVMQERGFDSDPSSNLVVGLAFCQLWYSEIPKELQLDPSSTYVSPEVPVCRDFHMSIDFSKDNDAREDEGVHSGLHCDSNTSVAIDKVIDDKQVFMDVDDIVKKEASIGTFQPQEFYTRSAEASGSSDDTFSNYSGDLPRASIFYSQGLPPLLLPIKLPSSHENLEDAIYMHRKLHNNYYDNALKHLRVALYSTPPVLEALHPLIQMLLLGDQVQEAVDELEISSHRLDTVLQLRMKASLTEHFDSGNNVKICTCFEDILKKDPTCSDSLARLTLMHHRGDYDTRSLMEMIAMHLDATYGLRDTWQELASCFLRLCECEEDRISTFSVGSDRHGEGHLRNSKNVPDLFTSGESGRTWSLRARWWLNRHFHHRNLVSDISSGDLKLLTYKAAVGSHIYGRNVRYVVKATECIEKGNDNELYALLQTHFLNSVGFYSATRII